MGCNDLLESVFFFEIWLLILDGLVFVKETDILE